MLCNFSALFLYKCNVDSNRSTEELNYFEIETLNLSIKRQVFFLLSPYATHRIETFYVAKEHFTLKFPGKNGRIHKKMWSETVLVEIKSNGAPMLLLLFFLSFSLLFFFFRLALFFYFNESLLQTFRLKNGMEERSFCTRWNGISSKLIRKRNVISNCYSIVYCIHMSRARLISVSVFVSEKISVYCFGTSNQSLSMPCVAWIYFLKSCLPATALNVAQCSSSFCQSFIRKKFYIVVVHITSYSNTHTHILCVSLWFYSPFSVVDFFFLFSWPPHFSILFLFYTKFVGIIVNGEWCIWKLMIEMVFVIGFDRKLWLHPHPDS